MITLYFYSDEACTRPDPAGLYFRGSMPIEVKSGLIDQAYVRWVAKHAWGNSTMMIVAWDANNPIGRNDETLDYWKIPDNARMFTVEGKRDNAGVVPAVWLIPQAKA